MAGPNSMDRLAKVFQNMGEAQSIGVIHKNTMKSMLEAQKRGTFSYCGKLGGAEKELFQAAIRSYIDDLCGGQGHDGDPEFVLALPASQRLVLIADVALGMLCKDPPLPTETLANHACLHFILWYAFDQVEMEIDNARFERVDFVPPPCPFDDLKEDVKKYQRIGQAALEPDIKLAKHARKKIRKHVEGDKSEGNDKAKSAAAEARQFEDFRKFSEQLIGCSKPENKACKPVDLEFCYWRSLILNMLKDRHRKRALSQGFDDAPFPYTIQASSEDMDQWHSICRMAVSTGFPLPAQENAVVYTRISDLMLSMETHKSAEDTQKLCTFIKHAEQAQKELETKTQPGSMVFAKRAIVLLGGERDFWSYVNAGGQAFGWTKQEPPSDLIIQKMLEARSMLLVAAQQENAGYCRSKQAYKTTWAAVWHTKMKGRNYTSLDERIAALKLMMEEENAMELEMCDVFGSLTNIWRASQAMPESRSLGMRLIRQRR
jgi:hypothetical protein